MISLTDVAKWFRNEPHQIEALKWLQTQLSADTLTEFATYYRNGDMQTPNIELVRAARYYRDLSHQKEAFEWLQTQLSAEVLEEFARRYRTKPSPPERLSLEQMYRICVHNSRAKLEPFIQPLNDGFNQYDFTPIEICHFLAQVLHESGEFLYQEEIASGAAYEMRADLGNVIRGDGVRFKGRGLIQVTGRHNYTQFNRDMAFLKINFLERPELLAEMPYCVWSAFWYWNSRNLSQWARRDDLRSVTLRVNGGYNGLADREKYLIRAKRVLL